MTSIRGQAWLPEEEAVLIERYPESGPQGCADYLPGRSYKAITSRAEMLGIRFDRHGAIKLEQQHLELSRMVRYWHGPVEQTPLRWAS